MSNVNSSGVPTSGVQSNPIMLTTNPEQQPTPFTRNSNPDNRTPSSSSATTAGGSINPSSSKEELKAMAENLAGLCATVDSGITVNGLGTMFMLIELAQVFSQQACELGNKMAALPQSEAYRSNPIPVLKELREVKGEYDLAREKIILVVHELAKNMAILERRPKDRADTELFDNITGKILSWNGSTNYRHAWSCYEQKQHTRL